MRSAIVGLAIGLCFVTGAHAQSSFSGSSYTPYLAPSQSFNNEVFPTPNAATDEVVIGINSINNSTRTGIAPAGAMLPLSAFASAYGLSTAIQQENQMLKKLNSGIAAVAAMNVMPPNPGDRFSLSLGGGEFGGAGGAGMSFAFRPPEFQNVVAYAGYATTGSQNLFKGGVSFSFH